MKAIVYRSYGSPENLELEEIEKPVVEDDQVLIKVRASSVNPYDWHFLTGTPFLARLMAGPFKPKHEVLGVDAAGQVEAVGPNVERFQAGDEVFGLDDHGCFAEYVCMPEAHLAQKPASMSFEQAATVPLAGLTALQGLRDKGQIQPGQKVLVNGASGGVGTFAVQIAKSFGAEVTGVCSARNVDLVRSLGADQVVDYTAEDFAQSGQRYDLVFDAVAKRSLSDCKRVLTPQGVYVTTEFSPGLLLRSQWAARTGSQRLVPLLTRPNREDLLVLAELFEGGKVTPVIDRDYTLSEVPEAIRYLSQGHARGKVVITVWQALREELR